MPGGIRSDPYEDIEAEGYFFFAFLVAFFLATFFFATFFAAFLGAFFFAAFFLALTAMCFLPTEIDRLISTQNVSQV